MLLALWQSSGLFPGVQGDLGTASSHCIQVPFLSPGHIQASGRRATNFIIEFSDDCAGSDVNNVMTHKSEEKREMPC